MMPDDVIAAWRVARPEVRHLVLEVLRGSVTLDEALARLPKEDKGAAK